ncbi:epoxide hydrolase 1 [Xylona heveae TC161]|uniref:Epoxide hydrolase 1 n=1 Tax=Xylona heveae (strain CBS 132557 / TC161) TaxID=1328760 RepID=A0A165JPY3_XYLHT|nr:epoxide hydrolase 1 [Xylona heveae TC161]KZF26498.1 epoxide hydrolase 1 [Xylona heveae TC161]
MDFLRPYSINVPEQEIQYLKQKLSLTRFPDELDEAAWSYGAPLADVKRLVSHWRDSFDWKSQESQLNKLPQFTTAINIENLGTWMSILYTKRVKSRKPFHLSFVMASDQVAGPGSFIEVAKILKPLAKGSTNAPAFHVIAPSLPNFGFSEGVKKKGFGLEQYAETCHKLMLSLGYSEYVTQGGDWGFYITRTMGRLFPDNCKVSHINLIVALQHIVTPYSERERVGLSRTMRFNNEDSGYMFEQGTKPQTLGYSLHDSPVGLLAWIFEKLHDWTDNYPWTDDEILTWISIYWFSRAGPAASLRIYYEAKHDQSHSRVKTTQWISHVKLGVAYLPREIIIAPKAWARCLGPVIYQSESDTGGHFCSWEKPNIIIDDLRSMLGNDGVAYRSIRGRSGYDKVDSRL